MYESRCEKTVLRVSNQVRHKPGCTTTEDGWTLEISSDLGSRGLYYSCSEYKDADQLRGYREADLHLCFCICKKPVFSRRGSYVVMPHEASKVTYYENLLSKYCK